MCCSRICVGSRTLVISLLPVVPTREPPPGDYWRYFLCAVTAAETGQKAKDEGEGSEMSS